MLRTRQDGDSRRPETAEMGMGPMCPESRLGTPDLPIFRPDQWGKCARESGVVVAAKDSASLGESLPFSGHQFPHLESERACFMFCKALLALALWNDFRCSHS